MVNSIFILLIPLLPLAGFVVLGIGGKNYFKRSAGLIGTMLMLGALLFSLYIAYNYFFVAGKTNGVYQLMVPARFTWLSFSNGLSIDMGIILDPISVMMLVVITFVSLMVHVFSLWYMKGEDRFSTYYAFLGLFTFSMLGLVLSSNIFQLYMFWELVGVSSYLLIGFYYERPAAVAAAKKAFIVTRFADLAFLIGILLLGFQAGTFDFSMLIQRLTDTQSTQFITATNTGLAGISVLTWALTLVFIGGAGKSAMFPLHIWLPDAMEGPTPVSALIHAATMVVAGVYLVARLFPVFHLNGAALQLVMYAGAASALFAATIACTQTDIKRVLAYSTMSQIGYMMFALGVGGEDGLGFTASMFHLFTHAFFKSLLFLASGAVIHFVHSNEVRGMGSLRKLLPVTHLVFLTGCLAIAGIPPFAGFFSKEEILLAAWHSNKFIYGIALFTSGFTAFYMFRLYLLIFWNKPAETGEHHGEGTWLMKIPLVFLGLLTLTAGFIPFGQYVSADGKPMESQFHLLFSMTPVAVAITGILLAVMFFKKPGDRAARTAAALGGFYRAASRKFYIDEIYQFITRKIIFNLIARPAAWADKNIVDGVMNGLATTTVKLAYLVKGIQSGKVQQYALVFFGGIVTLAILLIYVWK